MYMYVCVYVYVYVYPHVYVYVYIYICIYRRNIHTYIHHLMCIIKLIHVFIFMHIYIYTQESDRCHFLVQDVHNEVVCSFWDIAEARTQRGATMDWPSRSTQWSGHGEVYLPTVYNTNIGWHTNTYIHTRIFINILYIYIYINIYIKYLYIYIYHIYIYMHICILNINRWVPKIT